MRVIRSALLLLFADTLDAGIASLMALRAG